MDAKKLMIVLVMLLKKAEPTEPKTQSLESIKDAALRELKDITGADLPAMQARFAETAKNNKDLAVQATAKWLCSPLVVE